MDAFIKIDGQAVSVEVTIKGYEYLDQVKRKDENLGHEEHHYLDRHEFDEYIIARKADAIPKRRNSGCAKRKPYRKS